MNNPEISPCSKKEEQLSTLLDVCRYMSEEKDLDRLLDYIGRQVLEALQAERCGIFLLDEEKQEIWSKVAIGEKQEIRFPKGTGIAGRTIDTGKPELIPDAYQCPDFNRSIDEKTGFRTRDILSIPLTNLQGKSIGCFQVINKKEGTFNEEDQDFLIAFGSQAAVEIESTQLYQKQQEIIEDLIKTQNKLHQKMEQLQVVYELEKQANESQSISQFFQTAIEKTVKATNAQRGSIFLIKKDEPNHLKLFFGMGEGTEKIKDYSMEITKGLAGEALKTGKPIIENKVNKNILHHKEVDDILNIETQTMIVVPIEKMDPRGKDKKYLGVIEIINHNDGSFSEEDLEFTELIGSEISSLLLRRTLLEEKQKSQRLATIGQLANTIIHDFKNPMAVIRGMSELLANPKIVEEKRLHLVKIISAQVDRCTNMTKDILSFSRGETKLDLTEIEAQQFLSDICELLEVEVDKLNVELFKDFSYSGKLRLDSDRLKRVIFNLTNNALEMLKEGDKLSLTCQQRDDNHVEIRITDTGPGVPEHLRPTLFEAFVTHGKKGGTGLGLHIAKDIVEKHGGKIYLDEEVTTGASFVICLKPPAP